MKFSTRLMVALRRSLSPAISALAVVILLGNVCISAFAGEMYGSRTAFQRDPAAINAGFSSEGNNCVVDNDKKQSGGGAALIIAPDAYSYSVVGSGCGHSVYGVLNADGNGGVSGYLYLENGEQTSFYGDWIADGVAEGVDNNGNLYTVKVDN